MAEKNVLKTAIFLMAICMSTRVLPHLIVYITTTDAVTVIFNNVTLGLI
jgi:hypothetical protein